MEMVELLLATDKVDVNSKNRDSSTPLSRAARGGHMEVAKPLLARDDVQANSKSNEGLTLLSEAAWTANRKREILELLLNNEQG